MISFALAAALFAAGEPAAAQTATTATAATPPAAKAAKADKDGMVCRREAVIGSKLKTRVCMTQAEWDQRQRDDREMIEKAQSLKPLSGN